MTDKLHGSHADDVSVSRAPVRDKGYMRGLLQLASTYKNILKEKGSTPGKVLFLALFSALFIVLLLQIVLFKVLKKVQ